MGVNPDETAAHRRWLITIVITIVFGGFGAVMAYLSYVNSSKPSPSRASSSAPAKSTTVAPPAAEPSSDEKGTDRPGKGEGHRDK